MEEVLIIMRPLLENPASSIPDGCANYIRVIRPAAAYTATYCFVTSPPRRSSRKGAQPVGTRLVVYQEIHSVPVNST